MLLIILAALAPVIVLFFYIYRKDKINPEPTGQLIKAFFYGCLSALVSLIFVEITCTIAGIDTDMKAHASIIDAMADSFFSAAIPEELGKLLMLWLLLRNNKHYDEHFDGIVYAACIGLGFAGLENIMYLLEETDDVISLAINRAIFSVPGHFLFACIMGYFYSLYHFRISRTFTTKMLIIVAPVIAHGLYDGILFMTDISETVSVICMIAFLVFFHYLRKYGVNKINKLLATDNQDTDSQEPKV